MSTPVIVRDNAIVVRDSAYTDIEIIDDFEDGNRSGWTVPGSTGSDSVISPGLDGTDHRWQHNGFREAHLAGADAVDRGPAVGDTFEFWFRIDNITGSPVINRFEFAADGINEPSKYRIEFEANTGDPEFQLEKIEGGSQIENVTDPGVEFQQGQNYSVQIAWRNGNNNVEVQAFEEPSHTAFSNTLSIAEPSPGSDFEQPGVYLFANSNNTISWDEIRILP